MYIKKQHLNTRNKYKLVNVFFFNKYHINYKLEQNYKIYEYKRKFMNSQHCRGENRVYMLRITRQSKR